MTFSCAFLQKIARHSLAALWLCSAAAHAVPSVFVDELTTQEVSAAVAAGYTTVIIPVGGTEQSGPHLALGKHNARVKVLAGRIATNLGNTLVAPTVSYVPEGNINPPTQHSFKQHGFTHIVLLGDHGGYQSQLKTVADSLNQGWAGSPARAQFVAEYYTATETAYVDALKAKGLTAAQIGLHAGTADTALLMATVPSMVKPELFNEAFKAGKAGGTQGDPRAASTELGQLGVDVIVNQTTAAIRRAAKEPR